MKPFFILVLCFCLTGCMTIGEKRIPMSDVDSHTAAVFVQTNEKLYKQNEYLTLSPVVKEDPLFNSELIIPNEMLLVHQETTQKLLGTNEFLKVHGNSPIKGTGVNLTKPFSILSIIGIIAAVILCPSILVVVWKVVHRSRRSLKKIVDSIELADDNTTKAQLKELLSKKLNDDEKLLISTVKHQ